RRKVLDKALEAAGIERNEVYTTNAVKHFKNGAARQAAPPQEARHERIDACRWWLDNEIDLVQPAIAVALGATAARGLMRKALSINANRGRLIALTSGVQGLITVHPSYLLRLPEARDKRREFDLLAKDLRIANDAARRARR